MDRRLFLEALAGAALGGSLLPAESAGLQGGRAFADRDRELSPEGTELETDVLEQHVGLEARIEATGQEEGEVTAARFSDSVGIGSYRIDLHPSTTGQNYLDISSLPFEIPLGVLLPRRMQNLIPACKNIGTTHITNGCYRLHPVEWSIGEAAGLLASYCLENDVRPHAVRAKENELEAFQHMLSAEGIPLRWPEEQARTPQ